MTITRVSMLLGAALVMGSAAGAQAADLYGAQGGGSIKDGYVAPVACCRPAWYFRIDGGYSFHDDPKANAEGADLAEVRWKNAASVGGGVGMYFSRGLRGDLTYDHGFKADVTATAGANIVGAGNPYIYARVPVSRDVFLANMYYDFDTGSRFTPYIGGGVGFVRHKVGTGDLTQSLLTGGTGYGTVDSHSSTHVAAAAMVGATLALTGSSCGGGGMIGGGAGGVGGGSGCAGPGPGLMLDVGYRFLYLGKAKTGDTHYAGVNGDPDITDMNAHEIRVGLRYNLN